MLSQRFILLTDAYTTYQFTPAFSHFSMPISTELDRYTAILSCSSVIYIDLDWYTPVLTCSVTIQIDLSRFTPGLIWGEPIYIDPA